MKDEENELTKPRRGGRRPRPLKVKAVPAKDYPKDSKERLRAAVAKFVVQVIRELIKKGELVVEDGQVVLSKDAKAKRDALAAKKEGRDESTHSPISVRARTHGGKAKRKRKDH